MQLKEIYSTIRPAISIEFFPPKTEQAEAGLVARMTDFQKMKPAFCSVTYGAAGSTRDRTLDWVKRLRGEFHFEVMCHLTCVGHSRQDLDTILRQLRSINIENIIALRGDPPRGVDHWQPHTDGYDHAIGLVEAARSHGFSVAVAGFPETHPEAESPESEITFLKQKVDAGADVVITQFFFDNDDYYRYVDNARRAGVNVPIVPGIMPFRSSEDVEKFVTLYARTFNGPARVPARLRELLAKVESNPEACRQLGIDYATEQGRDLLAHGAPGIHFYCLNQTHSVEAILRGLNLNAA